MNINGTEIPAYMVNMIADHMTTLVKGGMEADVETLHHAVRMAAADADSLFRQMLAGNYMVDRDVIRNAIAAEVYADLREGVAA
jgi:hypothetical protein